MPTDNVVMISSTARDLPEHRREVMAACLAHDFQPRMMEHLPASDADAIEASLRLVDEAAVYLGLFAHRYGHVPAGQELSVTEMEYNRAIERGIPRLIFLMHDDHPLRAGDVETGPGAEKVKALKERLSKERVVAFFKSPDDLRARVISSLVAHREQARKAAAPPAATTAPAPTAAPPAEATVAYDPRNRPFVVPYQARGDRLVGRAAELEEARRRLTGDRPSRFGKARAVAFQGIGGLGKTQLAVEYAFRYGDSYPNGVIWLNADQDLDAQLTRLAVEARWIAPQSEQKTKFEVARHRLRTCSDCLIVFDNVEEIRAIEPYLPEPTAAPHLLITSRGEQPGFEPISLHPLSPAESLQLLVQEAERQPEGAEEEAAAQAIAERLGGLPLALETAAAYLRYRRAITWRQYQLALERDLKAALPARYLASATRHEADLFATLKINEEVFRDQPLLRSVLDLLTFSGPASMGLSLLAHLLGTGSADLFDPLHLGVELRLLEQVHDGGERVGKARYRIHRLVQEVRRQEQSLDGRAEWVDTVCRRLGDGSTRTDRPTDYMGTKEEFEAEVDHLRAWQEHALRHAPARASRLTYLLHVPSLIRGDFAETRKWLLAALELNEQGARDRELEAEIKESLSDTLLLYDPQRARLYAEEALGLHRESLGEEHEKTAWALRILGKANLLCGNRPRALECYDKALAIQRRVLGNDHIDVAQSLAFLGEAHLQRTPQRGLEYLREAQGILRRTVGEMHPVVPATYSLLSQAHFFLKDNQRALEHAKKALTLAQKVFGDNHPVTAGSHLSLGTLLAVLGNPEHARRHLRKCLSIHRDFLGTANPDSLKSMSSVVDALLSVKSPADACDLVGEWLDGLPKDHPAYQPLHKLRNKVLAATPALRARLEKPAREKKDRRKKKKH